MSAPQPPAPFSRSEGVRAGWLLGLLLVSLLAARLVWVAWAQGLHLEMPLTDFLDPCHKNLFDLDLAMEEYRKAFRDGATPTMKSFVDNGYLDHPKECPRGGTFRPGESLPSGRGGWDCSCGARQRSLAMLADVQQRNQALHESPMLRLRNGLRYVSLRAFLGDWLDGWLSGFLPGK